MTGIDPVLILIAFVALAVIIGIVGVAILWVSR